MSTDTKTKTIEENVVLWSGRVWSAGLVGLSLFLYLFFLYNDSSSFFRNIYSIIFVTVLLAGAVYLAFNVILTVEDLVSNPSGKSIGEQLLELVVSPTYSVLMIVGLYALAYLLSTFGFPIYGVKKVFYPAPFGGKWYSMDSNPSGIEVGGIGYSFMSGFHTVLSLLTYLFGPGFFVNNKAVNWISIILSVVAKVAYYFLGNKKAVAVIALGSIPLVQQGVQQGILPGVVQQEAQKRVQQGITDVTQRAQGLASTLTPKGIKQVGGAIDWEDMGERLFSLGLDPSRNVGAEKLLFLSVYEWVVPAVYIGTLLVMLAKLVPQLITTAKFAEYRNYLRGIGGVTSMLLVLVNLFWVKLE